MTTGKGRGAEGTALAHLVNLVQLIVGRVDRAGERMWRVISYQDTASRRLVWASWGNVLILAGWIVASWWQATMCS